MDEDMACRANCEQKEVRESTEQKAQKAAFVRCWEGGKAESALETDGQARSPTPESPSPDFCRAWASLALEAAPRF